MRNSKQIGQLAKEAKVSSGLGSGFRGKIPILNVHSTVNSQTPTHIPMHQDDCGKLVVPALGYALNVINPNGDKSFCCVVLHGDALMSSDIKDCLVAIGVQEKDVLTYPDHSANSIEQLEEYLHKPHGIFVTNERFFVGMEANAMVYLFVSSIEGDYNNKSIRCHLMRAVSQLCVVELFREDRYNFVFEDANLCSEFIDCAKILKMFAFKCETCAKQDAKNIVVICKSCQIGCHRGHSVKWIDVEYDLKLKTVNCSCQETSLCLFLNEKSYYEPSDIDNARKF